MPIKRKTFVNNEIGTTQSKWSKWRSANEILRYSLGDFQVCMRVVQNKSREGRSILGSSKSIEHD